MDGRGEEKKSICRLKGGGGLMRFSAGMNIFMKVEPPQIYLAAESCTKNKRFCRVFFIRFVVASRLPTHGLKLLRCSSTPLFPARRHRQTSDGPQTEPDMQLFFKIGDFLHPKSSRVRHPPGVERQ